LGPGGGGCRGRGGILRGCGGVEVDPPGRPRPHEMSRRGSRHRTGMDLSAFRWELGAQPASVSDGAAGFEVLGAHVRADPSSAAPRAGASGHRRRSAQVQGGNWGGPNVIAGGGPRGGVARAGGEGTVLLLNRGQIAGGTRAQVNSGGLPGKKGGTSPHPVRARDSPGRGDSGSVDLTAWNPGGAGRCVRSAGRDFCLWGVPLRPPVLGRGFHPMSARASRGTAGVDPRQRQRSAKTRR